MTDEQRYGELVQEHWARLVRIVMRTGVCRADAENAVQEAAFEGWSKLKKDRGAGTSIREMHKWLATVALRTAWREHKKKAWIVLVEEVAEVQPYDPGFEELSDSTRQVYAELAALPLELKAVMTLLMEGFTAQETVGCLAELGYEGASEQDVHVLRRRARRILADRLKISAEGGGQP